MDQCPIQGESKTVIRLTLRKPEINAGSMGHQARKGFSLNIKEKIHGNKRPCRLVYTQQVRVSRHSRFYFIYSKWLSKQTFQILFFYIGSVSLTLKVVKNTAILKKTKVLFFNAYVLTHMMSLYNYATKHATVAEDDKARVKDAAHQLLLSVCCSFKFGICFGNKAGGLAQRQLFCNSPIFQILDLIWGH